MLAGLFEQEFATVGQVLAVNTRSFSHARAVRVGDVGEGETPAQGFDGALWECTGDPLVGLASLRSRVRPQGLLLVSLCRKKRPWERLLSAFAGEPDATPTLEALCAAPILAGLEDARVLVESPELAVVVARVPAVPDPLDSYFASSFFTQPA